MEFWRTLLHPRKCDMVKLAKKYQIIVGLCTNGSLLHDEKVAEALVEGGQYYLIVALLTDLVNRYTVPTAWGVISVL
jgi:hypothetical protein